MSRFSLFLLFASLVSIANAQIGYQVAVVDQTTGEPKANTNVSVTVTITDNAGEVITTSSQSATTDDFGVTSLQVGNESTFANTDWTKLPLWIAATVDGVSLGKTQILTVPVAEHAKHTGVLTQKKLVGTWRGGDGKGGISITFTSGGSYTYVYNQDGFTDTKSGGYEIDGNHVILFGEQNLHYSPKSNKLVDASGDVFSK